jgi:hypothetical protein
MLAPWVPRLMSFNGKRDATRFWGLPIMAAVATMLMAATIDPSGDRLRLQAMPRIERQRLVENLQKFDMLYSADQQQILRDLDHRFNELDPERQAQYLAALRRYHNWLHQLPELKQAELKEKAPGERMALVKKVVAEYPTAPGATAKFLQFVDVGDHSPFELAAIYQLWQALSPGERQQIEKALPGTRRQMLYKTAEKKKISSEIKPAAGDEEQWISEFKSGVRVHRQALLNLLEADTVGTEILRRQAINFHFLEKKNQVKAVTTERLAGFLASFPPWLQSSFDHYPPDEARRRLGVVYRLVFPPGSEIKFGSPTPASSAGAKSKPAPPRAAPQPAGKTPAEPGTPPS